MVSVRDEIGIHVSGKAITYSLGRARPGMVRLWTIQPLSTWERLREQRTLWADPTGEAFFQEFRDSYDWMCQQMRHRLPGYQGHYPWWAYEHKPDLRHHQTASLGRFVRLELVLPPARVLLSAYGAWHYVLTPGYLPQAVEESEYERERAAWEEELRRHGLDRYTDRPLPEPWFSRMTASWECIFDVDDLRPTNTIQACFERLNLEDVVKVTVFTPRQRAAK